jgi:uncharacterized protein YbgA (DUF1722 family)/uncharacterized protein YbbK (DUF523 family)
VSYTISMNSKPVIFASRCLGFAATRYNAQIILDEWVERLKPFVCFIDLCPEADIGLGVPRDPLRLVKEKDEIMFFQPATGIDYTERMNSYIGKAIESLPPVDGFILKSRSPSCGIGDVRLYGGIGREGPIAKTAGLWGAAVKSAFPGFPAEDEGRLKNFKIREHFFTSIFLLSSFRVRAGRAREGDAGALVDFHSDNKLLLMALNQAAMRSLGRIIANREGFSPAHVADAYGAELIRAIQRPAGAGSSINVLMHALGYFKDDLSRDEKSYILDSFTSYRAGKIPLSVPQHLIRALAVRFGTAYLLRQSFFNPYQEALMAITDSGKGRDV